MTMSKNLKYCLMALSLMIASLALAGEGPESFTEMYNGDQTHAKAANSRTIAKLPEVAEANRAVLVFYNDRATFDADAPDIALEDFEGGAAGPGQIIGCGSPLDSGASACFPAGGIEAGLEVHASSGTNVVALGPGIVPVNPTTWVASDLFNDVTSLEFTNGDAFAVGLDIFDFFGAPSITINIYSASGLIGTTMAISGSFWGVISDEAITRLELGVSSNVITLDNVAFGNPIVDTDGDGFPDDEDSCPESDLATSVVIDGCDSGVSNLLLDNGCTISDLIADCAASASNHGQFVSCVAHLTNSLKKDGIISGKDKGAIQRCAAKSSLP